MGKPPSTFVDCGKCGAVAGEKCKSAFRPRHRKTHWARQRQLETLLRRNNFMVEVLVDHSVAGVQFTRGQRLEASVHDREPRRLVNVVQDLHTGIDPGRATRWAYVALIQFGRRP